VSGIEKLLGQAGDSNRPVNASEEGLLFQQRLQLVLSRLLVLAALGEHSSLATEVSTPRPLLVVPPNLRFPWHRSLSCD
jgi:hypothetical protein